MTGKVRDWRDLLEQHPWVTDAVFRTTVSLVRFKHHGPFVPELATLLDYCHEASRQIRHEEQKALPPPERPVETQWSRMDGPQRAAFLERHIAIGKLRAYAGATDLNVPFEASEQEIMGVIGQMRAEGFMRRQLERVAAGELVGPGDLIEGGLRGRL